MPRIALWHCNENKATPSFTYLGSIEVSKNRTDSISPNKARRFFVDEESSCRFSSIRDPNIRGYRWALSRTECFSSMHFSQLNIWILKFHPRFACISWIWRVINISSHYSVANSTWFYKQARVCYLLKWDKCDVLKSVAAKNKTPLLQIVVPDGDPG